MFISVSDAAEKFHISKRRVQVLCEQGRIDGANRTGGGWLIPASAPKPEDGRRKKPPRADEIPVMDTNLAFCSANEAISLKEVCEILSISTATAKNWLRLGKLISIDGGKSFGKEYITQLALEIKSGKDGRLKNRRNKKGVSGKSLYKDYITCERNRVVAENILASCAHISEDELRVILAYFSLQLYQQKNGVESSAALFSNHSTRVSNSAVFNRLIADLLGNVDVSKMELSNIKPVFEQYAEFVPGEDTLGFIYISLRDLGQRKQTGAYYTPEKTVTTLLEALGSFYENEDNTYCDPCCGTGNFLIGLANRGIPAANIYGQDIDELSVLLTRINLYLLDSTLSLEDLLSHFTIGNTLEQSYNRKFSVILGNPPWGYDYSRQEIACLLSNYRTARSKGTESYDLFIEKGLLLLQNHGYLAYVLPEALLGVSSHRQAREMILEQASFRFVNYLGNAFSGVQCPSIVLGLQKDGGGCTIGCKVTGSGVDFVMKENRKIDASLFAFHINDEEYACMEAIRKIPNAKFLAGNAKFALGIVTGNNKEFLTASKQAGYEVVLKGSDILRYSKKETNHFIKFVPEAFQQAAPAELYRAREKLLYRFISEVPVFTYDDRQTLSLNSCNIVIPQIEGMDMKYILAVLNSSVASFYISKQFHSVKLLRSHIEALPIPMISGPKQCEIVEKVEDIMNSVDKRAERYAGLDEFIMDIYQLTAHQRKTIHNALAGKNMFLA